MFVPPSQQQSAWIGIDIGGTFTDFVVYSFSEQTLQRMKVLSTPLDPSDAVLQGLAKFPQLMSRQIVHGSTVATNAILERKGARTALITTKGFRDVLIIGRQDRPELYDLFPSIPPLLVPREWTFEITERVDYGGNIVTPLQENELDVIIQEIKAHEIQSVAVSFLFSFVNPTHERSVTNRLRAEGLFVTASSEILPEFREYERTSTTVVNAYVSPCSIRIWADWSKRCSPASFTFCSPTGGASQ